MPDGDLSGYVRSVLALRQDVDAVSMAEAFWLAAVTSAPSAVPASPAAGTAGSPITANSVGPTREPLPRTIRPDRRHPASQAASARQSAAPRRTKIPAPEREVRVQRATALPEPLDLARSLRPFKRRWPAGRRLQLDIDATVASYARTWQLIPEFRPAPERWFEVSLVVDDSPSMAVWSEVVSGITVLLHQLGAFRNIRRWRMSLAGTEPVLRNQGGQLSGADQLRAPDGRRLIIVVSDGSAPGWFRPEVWQVMRGWAASTPTALISPLATRLWCRTGLDLPAVRVGPAAPGSPNPRLRYLLPYLLQNPRKQEKWLPLPVATFSPHMLGSWARTLMRGDPRGCDALLIPTAGRPSRDRDEAEDDPPSGAALVKAFRRTASPVAARLAVLCAPFERVSMPLLHLIGQELIPGASIGDLAEVMVGGLFHPPASVEGDEVLHFRTGVRERLRGLLTEPDAWRVYETLQRHAITHDHAGRSFAAPVPDLLGDRLAQASRETLEFLDAVPSNWHEGELIPVAEPAKPGSAGGTDMTTSGGTGNRDYGQPANRITPLGREGRSVPTIWGNVPQRNKNFTGREGLLTRLRESIPYGAAPTLVEAQPRVLQGLGGVGKTAAATEFAHRYQSDYDLVWWVPADQLPLVRASLAGLAGRLDLAPATASGIESAATAVLDALRRGEPYARWLLVFDNADQPEEFNDLIPRGPGHVLITSRNHRWQSVIDTVAVDVFTRPESAEFLARRVPYKLAGAATDRLAAMLGDLPLALEQAGAVLAETGMAVDEYQRLLDESVTQIMAEGRPTDYPLSMSAAWMLSVSALKQQLPQALEMLRCCAFFSPDPIPRDVFRRAESLFDTRVGELIADPILLARAIRELGRFGLVKIDGHTFVVHRLIQALLRDEISKEEQDLYRHVVHLILTNAVRSVNEQESWPLYRELLPHVASPVTDLAGCQDSAVRAFGLDVLRFLFLSSDLESCRSLAERFIAQWMRDSDPDNFHVISAQHQMGDALRELGRYPESLRLTETTLSKARKTFGEENSLTLALRGSYGADLRARGDFAAARTLDEESFLLCQAGLGPTDPGTLDLMNGLALDHELASDYQQARKLYQRVYVLQRDAMTGVHITSLLTSWNGLARALRLCGSYPEARDTGEDAYEFGCDRLGSGHYVTLRAAKDLSVALRHAGTYDQALEMAEETHERFTRLFGEEHPDTTAAAISLANIQRMVGQGDRALELTEQAAARYLGIYGQDHPFAYACTGNLAVLRRMAGDLQRARQLNEAALVGLDAALSRDHFYSLTVAANLASDLAALGDPADAEALGEDTLTRSRTLLGAEHPMILGCTSNLVLDLRTIGATERADQLAADIVNRFGPTLGTDHQLFRAVGDGQRIDFDFDPQAV